MSRNVLSFSLAILTLTAANVCLQAGDGDRKAIEQLVADLRNTDPAVRAKAAHALRKATRAGRMVVPALAKALEDPDETVRQEAAAALTSFGPDAAMAAPQLIRLLQEEKDLWIRLHAVWVLAAIGPKAEKAIPALKKTLDAGGENSVLAVEAARALGSIGKTALPALIEAMRKKDPFIRRRAAAGLADLGPDAKDAVPVLVDALGDTEDGWVPRVACWALRNIGPAAKNALPRLRELLKENNNLLQMDAARAMVAIDPKAEEARPVLRKLIERYPGQIGVKAAAALGKMEGGLATALPVLIKGLEDPGSSFARIDAATGLGELGPPAKEAVPALLRAYRGGDETLREAAARALKRIDPEAARGAGIR